MKRFILLGAVSALLLLPACRDNTTGTSGLVSGTGTLLVTGDCHAWHVHADSGPYYELRNLSAEFQHTNLRVRFTLVERRDAASTCMMGPMADVVAMTPL